MGPLIKGQRHLRIRGGGSAGLVNWSWDRAATVSAYLGRLNGLGHREGEFGPLVIMARSAIRSCGMPAGNNMAQRPMVPFLQP